MTQDNMMTRIDDEDLIKYEAWEEELERKVIEGELILAGEEPELKQEQQQEQEQAKWDAAQQLADLYKKGTSTP